MGGKSRLYIQGVMSHTDDIAEIASYAGSDPVPIVDNGKILNDLNGARLSLK